MSLDATLAIASKRDVREYSDEPIPPPLEARILDAGRLSGSARNLQPWRFVVAESPEGRAALASAVYVPGAIRGAALAVLLLALPGSALAPYDVGRAAQNMMLGAWAEGIVSCPHGIRDPSALVPALPVAASERPIIAISFGWPVRPREPGRRAAGEWSARARRLPLAELVRRA